MTDALAALDARAAALPLVIADAHDEPALTALARTTTAVVTTVGPYLAHGAALVAACVAAGTAYCDLTGEVPFVRQMIDRHHAAAVASGARIVHCCGFDSVPSDLGVWCLQRDLEAQAGRGAPAVTALFEIKGGASGGTVASMLGLVDAAGAQEPVDLGQVGQVAVGERGGMRHLFNILNDFIGFCLRVNPRDRFG